MHVRLLQLRARCEDQSLHVDFMAHLCDEHVSCAHVLQALKLHNCSADCSAKS